MFDQDNETPTVRTVEITPGHNPMLEDLERATGVKGAANVLRALTGGVRETEPTRTITLTMPVPAFEMLSDEAKATGQPLDEYVYGLVAAGHKARH